MLNVYGYDLRNFIRFVCSKANAIYFLIDFSRYGNNLFALLNLITKVYEKKQ